MSKNNLNTRFITPSLKDVAVRGRGLSPKFSALGFCETGVLKRIFNRNFEKYSIKHPPLRPGWPSVLINKIFSYFESPNLIFWANFIRKSYFFTVLKKFLFIFQKNVLFFILRTWSPCLRLWISNQQLTYIKNNCIKCIT